MNDINDNDFIRRVKSILKHSGFSLGIGDIANATGVSQRKLRYWEEKEYIQPSSGSEEGKHRKYSYFTLAKVSLIESYLESGYSLGKAVEKAEQHSKVAQATRKIISDRLSGIKRVDDQYEVDLGEVEGAEGKHIVAILKEDSPTRLILTNVYGN